MHCVTSNLLDLHSAAFLCIGQIILPEYIILCVERNAKYMYVHVHNILTQCNSLVHMHSDASVSSPCCHYNLCVYMYIHVLIGWIGPGCLCLPNTGLRRAQSV